MSGTGTGHGDIEDDRAGAVAEPARTPEATFAQVASGTAVTGSSDADLAGADAAAAVDDDGGVPGPTDPTTRIDSDTGDTGDGLD